MKGLLQEGGSELKVRVGKNRTDDRGPRTETLLETDQDQLLEQSSLFGSLDFKYNHTNYKSI